jgi:hypothetical protein
MENLQQLEGLSPLLESAIRLNEIYKALLAGGFTSEEALSMVTQMTKKSN